ncbi:thionin-like protein 2 [Diospyros lotus]|uniref:thionin-like protein 2 n=1 Tax=Diospyros lotus TaxID=55363 RepID=UPI002253534C|nr:thionin-like protein 2 [Diospyros lotus]
MERSRIAAALVVALVVCGMATAVAQLSPVAQPSPATSFRDCYIPCFILCIVIPPHSAFGCSLDCLRSCIIPQAHHAAAAAAAAAATRPETRLHFCKLGCASSLCANISTRQNPSGEKVESCVGSCSGLCTSN